MRITKVSGGDKRRRLSSETRTASAPGWVRRSVLALLVLVPLGGIASIAPAAPVAEPQRVEVAPGRSMTLLCMGAGPRTVVFDAGGSDWSSIWAKVQPAIATRARACAYDRAGLGASDAAAEPRSPIAVVEDLHALLKAANLARPVILVGHSLGGFNMKLYAALYPEDVAGVVLLDPSEERGWARTRDVLTRKYGAALVARSELMDQRFLERLVAKFRDCAAEARGKGLEPGSAPYRRCTDPPRPQLGPEREAERTRIMGGAGYQAAQASELASSVYGTAANDPAYAALFRPGMLGHRPMIVLNHTEDASDDPLDKLSTEQSVLLADESAHLSLDGVHRLVDRSGHYLELDRPDAVIAAIAEVLDKLRR